jgi:hypothetical protein
LPIEFRTARVGAQPREHQALDVRRSRQPGFLGPQRQQMHQIVVHAQRQPVAAHVGLVAFRRAGLLAFRLLQSR